jgi:AraC-like DNA-binding protein
MGVAAAASPAYDSVMAARFLLGAAAAGGADARQLARDAQLPGWTFTAEQAIIPSRTCRLLWERIERALEDPHAALTIASRHQAGQLDLFDYLFTTAATLRQGLLATADFLHLLTTNGRLRIEAETDQQTTYSYRHAEPGGRGEQLCLQFCVALFCLRARAATGQPVVPAHVAFTQPPPRSRHVFTETLGTRRVDFDAPATTFTFRARDLDRPLLDADPALARILARYAQTLPTPPPATWHEHFQQLLAQVIRDGSPSLAALARCLAVSPRTLQRQLSAHGTTWRAELDAARQRRARQDLHGGAVGMASLAHRLGYGDARSARRALRRWDLRPGEPGRINHTAGNRESRPPEGAPGRWSAQ